MQPSTPTLVSHPTPTAIDVVATVVVSVLHLALATMHAAVVDLTDNATEPNEGMETINAGLTWTTAHAFSVMRLATVVINVINVGVRIYNALTRKTFHDLLSTPLVAALEVTETMVDICRH
jgi:hypothetical protein